MHVKDPDQSKLVTNGVKIKGMKHVQTDATGYSYK